MRLHFILWNYRDAFSPSIDLNIGSWWFSLYFDPRVWGFEYHQNYGCCKVWLLVGPFEINREYHEDEIEEQDAKE